MANLPDLATTTEEALLKEQFVAGMQSRIANRLREMPTDVPLSEITRLAKQLLRADGSGESWSESRRTEFLPSTKTVRSSFLCTYSVLRFWFRWFYTEKTHWKLHLEKTSEAFNLRPNQRTCVRGTQKTFGRKNTEISSFDFEISYKSGKLHKDADALSRHPEHRTSSPVTVAATSITSDSDHVCIAQQEDENISKVLHQLASGKRPPFQGEWRSGVLGAFRRVWHQLQMQDGILIRKDSSGKMKTVVPHSLVQEVLSQAHDNPTAGHLGVDKTASTIRERFYWPGYVRAVEEFVETCETCQRWLPSADLHAFYNVTQS